MKKFITLATAGFLFLSLQGVQAQKEVPPPAVPPMLEGQRPLAQPETREPASPKPTVEEKAKPGAKAKAKTKANGKKAKKTAKVKKDNGKKKAAKVTTKKGQKSKTNKKKRPAATPKEPAGPEEG